MSKTTGFQIANGILILSLENHQMKYGLTPAEVLLLHHMHRTNANGSPLGDWFIQKGEALTIDQEGKPAEEAYFNQHAGKHIDAREAVPAKTHARTNNEEIARLRKKYTGNITQGGVAKPAFEAVFGSAAAIQLPRTFAEIEEVVGIHFRDQPEGEDAGVTREVNSRREDLLRLGRADVAAIAGGMKLMVHHQDTKEQIIASIIEAETEKLAADEAKKTETEQAGKKSSGKKSSGEQN